jgi:toxin ParE1/3/4
MATRLIETIMKACEPLRHFPLAGPVRENLAPGLRVAFAGSYAIYYLHDEHDLTLVRVLHGARDAVALAELGGFAWRRNLASRSRR